MGSRLVSLALGGEGCWSYRDPPAGTNPGTVHQVICARVRAVRARAQEPSPYTSDSMREPIVKISGTIVGLICLRLAVRVGTARAENECLAPPLDEVSTPAVWG
jgi:hypothetical protein